MFKDIKTITMTFARKSVCYKLRKVKSIMSEMNFTMTFKASLSHFNRNQVNTFYQFSNVIANIFLKNKFSYIFCMLLVAQSS